jgi:hypothetical protein
MGAGIGSSIDNLGACAIRSRTLSRHRACGGQLSAVSSDERFAVEPSATENPAPAMTRVSRLSGAAYAGRSLAEEGRSNHR